GFCVDPGATRAGPETGFALLGNCAAVTADPRAPQPAIPAILTLTASVPAPAMPPVAEAVEEYDSYFRSEAGRAMLSRSGRAADVEVLDSFFRHEVLYLRLRDSGPPDPPGLASETWRGYLDLGGYLVAVSATALAEGGRGPDDPRAAMTLVRGFAQRLRQVNGVAVDRAVLEEVGLVLPPADPPGGAPGAASAPRHAIANLDTGPAEAYETEWIAGGDDGAGGFSPRSGRIGAGTLMNGLWAVGILRRLL
ncbi:MAG: hypothetical protein JJU40_13975, partial [Rhodobacteraceae bacterium]|nr:hypothetical protein [Paracoccaceae bacterium]